MAILRGDHDTDTREWGEVEPEPEDYGLCPQCLTEHGGGFCAEPSEPVVCACGLFHDDNCPDERGHGAIL